MASLTSKQPPPPPYATDSQYRPNATSPSTTQTVRSQGSLQHTGGSHSVTRSLLLFLSLAACMAGCVQGRELPPGRQIHLAALLPINPRFPFSYHKVMPALNLSVDKVTAAGGPLHGRQIQLHFGDSECSSAAAMNQMYNFYIKYQVDVFFGPCCDYAAAPVARQLHYWNLPQLTAGAIASDFARGKGRFFNQVTRVGASVNSLVDCLLVIMQKFGWKRVKQVYNPVAQDMVGEKVCHIVADGIHYGLRGQKAIPDIEQDYEKMDDVDHFLQRMPQEIGDWGDNSGNCTDVNMTERHSSTDEVLTMNERNGHEQESEETEPVTDNNPDKKTDSTRQQQTADDDTPPVTPVTVTVVKVASTEDQSQNSNGASETDDRHMKQQSVSDNDSKSTQ